MTALHSNLTELAIIKLHLSQMLAATFGYIQFKGFEN